MKVKPQKALLNRGPSRQCHWRNLELVAVGEKEASPNNGVKELGLEESKPSVGKYPTFAK